MYFRSRYWIDELEPEDANNEYRVLSFDIESKHSLDAVNAPQPIIAITGHDNFKDKYITFVLNPEGIQLETRKGEDWSVYAYDDERDMLLGFIDFVQAVDPDIITAWNWDTYDGPYLLNRMRNLNVDYSELSPINEVRLSSDFSRVRQFKGRDVIDMIPAFKKIYFEELESYSLNNVGAELLGLEKVQFNVGIGQLWEDNPEKLIEYNKRDVEIMAELDDKFGVWDIVKEIQSFVGINLQDCVHPTRMSQAYVMRKTHYKMPRKEVFEDQNEKKKFTGGYVRDSTPGISKNVAVLDLASQYPSSIISYNMSPDTKVDNPNATDKDTIGVGNGVYFEYEEPGFIPQILIELMEWRDEEKKKRDQYDADSEEYRKHDLRQYAQKVIANSLYGVLGSKYFMLYDKDIAKSTTFVGRSTVQWSLDRALDLGYQPIYSDTDSVMISVGENVDRETGVDKAEKMEKFINESYDDYADKNGIDLRKLGMDQKHLFKIEAEKFYSAFFMQENTKKKYAGHIRWKEGKWVDDWDFAQYGKKSDIAQISRDIEEEFLKKLLTGASKGELQEYVTEKCKKLKNGEYSLEYIGIPSRMKKEIHEYEADRPVLRASKYANKYTGEQFGRGDKPKYIYIKSTPTGLPDTDVVAFSEVKLPDGFKIDHDKMVRKTIRDKLKRILSSVGYDWSEMYRQSSNLLEI